MFCALWYFFLTFVSQIGHRSQHNNSYNNLLQQKLTNFVPFFFSKRIMCPLHAVSLHCWQQMLVACVGNNKCIPFNLYHSPTPSHKFPSTNPPYICSIDDMRTCYLFLQKKGHVLMCILCTMRSLYLTKKNKSVALESCHIYYKCLVMWRFVDADGFQHHSVTMQVAFVL